MVEEVKCFYHKGDLDGWCSGALVRYYFERIFSVPVKMYPINYGEKFPWNEVCSSDTVFMVDFSLEPEEMKQLADSCALFYWIDHHKGIIEDIENEKFLFGRGFPGIREIGTAACELVWKYLFFKDMPEFVKLLGRYDVWDHQNELFSWDEIENFQYGFKAIATDPEKDMKFWEDWIAVNNMEEDEQLSHLRITEMNGKSIKSYLEKEFQNILENRSYEIQWEGFNCLVINNDNCITNYMTSWPGFTGDIAISFANHKGSQWVVSLRTKRKDIDLSVIAKKYGGGGHAQAAGFTIDGFYPFGFCGLLKERYIQAEEP